MCLQAKLVKTIAVAALVSATATSTALAKVTARTPTGFTVALEADLAVSPQQAFDKFVEIGRWWDMAHSYSRDASNMRLDPTQGGAWIESLPNGGFVVHMRVTQVAPGARLVMAGGLGPLAFMGVNASMNVNFSKSEGGTKVSIGYAVGGFDPDEFKALSNAVDGVLTSQLARYVNYAGTGKP